MKAVQRRRFANKAIYAGRAVIALNVRIPKRRTDEGISEQDFHIMLILCLYISQSIALGVSPLGRGRNIPTALSDQDDLSRPAGKPVRRSISTSHFPSAPSSRLSVASLVIPEGSGASSLSRSNMMTR
jgi:hypothetical protein